MVRDKSLFEPDLSGAVYPPVHRPHPSWPTPDRPPKRGWPFGRTEAQYNSNTIIVKENCISIESWWKSLFFGHFQSIFSCFSLFFKRNHDFSTQFFRKVTQLTRNVFFSNTETFTSSKNCIKNCIFSPKLLKNFELFWWIVQLLLQLLYDCIVFGARDVKLYDCMW